MAILYQTSFSFAAFAVFLLFYTLTTGGAATFSEDASSSVNRRENVERLVDMESYLADMNRVKSQCGESCRYRPYERPQAFLESESGEPSSTGNKKKLPEFCTATFSLDAFAQGGDGCMYAFSLANVYKICRHGLHAGYPKAIIDVFPGGPRTGITAASFAPQNNKLYIFNKDVRVWRFSHVHIRSSAVVSFKLDKAYPKLITTNRHYVPWAAITTNTRRGKSQIIFLSGTEDTIAWKWKVSNEHLIPRANLRGSLLSAMQKIPRQPDAAFLNKKGDLLYFKGNKYQSLALRKRRKDSNKMPLGPHLFGALCGGTSNIAQLSDYTQTEKSL